MEITLTFHIESENSPQELIECVKDFLEFQNKQKNKEKTHDKRGLHIQDLHKRAKEYHLQNTHLSYKECIKAVSKPKIK